MNTSNDTSPIANYDIDAIRDALAARVPDTSASQTAQRRAAVAMILADRGGDSLDVLFMKRAEHDMEPWSGQMAFPGGRQDPCDATVEDAARRETREEMGLDLQSDMCIGRLDDVAGGRLTAYHLSVSPFVYYCPEPGVLTPNYEVAAAVWIPLTFLGNGANVRGYVFPLDPKGRNFPSFRFGPYTIWGLTYRIVSNFMELFGIELPQERPVTEVE